MILKKLNELFSLFTIGIIRFYRYFISPLLGLKCRFVPSCSEYSIEAFKKYGFFKGIYCSVRRILRCNPWGGSGIDELK